MSQSRTIVELPDWAKKGTKITPLYDGPSISKIYTISEARIDPDGTPVVFVKEHPDHSMYLGNFRPVADGIERALDRIKEHEISKTKQSID